MVRILSFGLMNGKNPDQQDFWLEELLLSLASSPNGLKNYITTEGLTLTESKLCHQASDFVSIQLEKY
jgi:hypothetical protein